MLRDWRYDDEQKQRFKAQLERRRERFWTVAHTIAKECMWPYNDTLGQWVSKGWCFDDLPGEPMTNEVIALLKSRCAGQPLNDGSYVKSDSIVGIFRGVLGQNLEDLGAIDESMCGCLVGQTSTM